MTITDRRSGTVSTVVVTTRLGGIPEGLCCKAPVRVATTAAITLNGLQAIDGITVAAGERVLVKDQSAAKDNGVYDAGTGDWTRSIDATTNGDLVEGTRVYVNQGSTQANTEWAITTDDDIVIDTSAIAWTNVLTSQFASQAEAVAGADNTKAMSPLRTKQAIQGGAFYSQGGTGSLSRTIISRLRDQVFLADYATLDGTTDDAAAVQAAVDALASGGVIRVPTSGHLTCAIASKVSIHKPVYFVGVPGLGGAGHFDALSYVFKFKWTGAGGGTMFEFSAVAGASNQRLSGGGMIGCALDGNGNTAAVGILIKSACNGTYRVFGEKLSTAVIDVTCLSSSPGLGESRSTQENDVIVYGQQGYAGSGAILRTGGVADADSSCNMYSVEGTYYDQPGVDIGNSDNDCYRSIRVTQGAGGSATAGVLCRANADINQTARDNFFLYCSPGAQPLRIQGTETATFASGGHKVVFYDRVNSAAPAFGTGSTTMTWCDNSTMDEYIAGNVVLPNGKAVSGVDNGGTTRKLLQASGNTSFLEGLSSGLRIRTNNQASDVITISGAGAIQLNTYGSAGALQTDGSGNLSTATLPIALGGTAGTTVPTARAALSIDQRTTFSNASYVVLSTDYLIAQTGTMSAARTVTLPAASSFNAGRRLIVIDESGTVTSANTVSLAPNGSDTINGSNTTQVAINVAFGFVELESNGSTKWTTTKVSLGSPLEIGGILSPVNGGTGIANNAASTLAITGSFGLTFTIGGATGVTLPASGTLATLAGSEELTNKTLNASVGKGTWTASGTWTLPALSLNGAISGGGNQLNNVIIGTSNPLAGTFTTVTASGNLTSTAGGFAGQSLALSASVGGQVPATVTNTNTGQFSAAGFKFIMSGITTNTNQGSTLIFHDIEDAGHTQGGLRLQQGDTAGAGVSNWLFIDYNAVTWDFLTNGTSRVGLSATQLNVKPTTASTSSTTGAIITGGGLGVAGAIYLGGKLGCASFVVASLPAGSAAGETVYASNCRVFNGAGTQEGAGVGTGGLVNYNSSAWKIAGTNVTAVA